MKCSFCKSEREAKIHGPNEYVCGTCFAKLTQLDQERMKELYVNCFDVGNMDKVMALDMVFKPGGRRS